MAKKKTDAELEGAMHDSLKAYAAGDAQFFDFIRDDARVFNVNSSEPIIGRAAFEESFGPTFTKTKRKVEVVHSDVVLTEDRAVLAQTLRITANDIASFVRQTVIWEKGADDGWKMSHIHNALVGQPIATGKIPKSAKEVRVLNERIATVAATVGVAQ